MSIVNYIFFQYPGFLICLLTIIFGIRLSNTQEEIRRNRQFIGCFIAIVGAIIEWFIPFIINTRSYIISSIGIFIIRFIVTILAFKMFSSYKCSTWVLVLFIILLIVYIGRTYYVSQIIYNMTNMLMNHNQGSLSFMDLFNNKSTLNVMSMILVIIPPISVYIDAFRTNRIIEK
jgi:hypothetical protein